MIKIYEKLMKKCIQLAKKAKGKVEPNPYVGAIIIDDKFNIISTGYHQKFGQNHAEVNAIKNANGKQKNKTLILNLEPCCHYGKTPPCVDLIIKSKIKKVVIGMKDPNPLVYEKGIKKLEDAGIEVIVGVLEDECKKLNEVFIKNQQKLPFVVIKSATTLDGKIATKNGNSKWITSEQSRKYVQKLREKFDAVMTSSNTVIADNPSMNLRAKTKKQPTRIIVDSDFRTDFLMKIYKKDSAKIILATCKNIIDVPENVEVIVCPQKNSHVDLKFLFEKLYEKEIYSVLIEAGSIFVGELIKENLADKIYQFIAPKITNDNSCLSFASNSKISEISECKNLKIIALKNIGNDILLEANFLN